MDWEKLQENLSKDVSVIKDGIWKDFFPNCWVFQCNTEEAWKEMRKHFICASESACVLGIGYETNEWLWEQKTGHDTEKSFNKHSLELMEKGSKNEAFSRMQFALDHGCTIYDGTRKLVVNINKENLDENGNPFMAATYDAIAVHPEINDGKPFIVEFKRSESFKAFKDNINPPPHYRVQVIKQLLVGELEASVLSARVVMFGDADVPYKRRVYEKEYWFSTKDEDVRFDIEQLRKCEKHFWNKYILTNKRPEVLLPEI